MKLNINSSWIIDAFNNKPNEGVGYTDIMGNSTVIDAEVVVAKVGRGLEFKNGKAVLNVVDFERFVKVEFYSEGVFFEDKEGNMLMIYTKFTDFVKDNLMKFGCIE